MPDRHWSNSLGYRYGFNGQEKDDEITDVAGATNTALFWEYDTRLGRRWNIDPIVKYFESPYSAFGGNPVFMIDPNGDDWYKNEKGRVAWNNTRGNIGDEVSLKGLKGSWTNIGLTYTIITRSYIPKKNDLPLPLRTFAAGIKLTTKVSLTGNYDDNGNFEDFSYTYNRTVGKTGDIDALEGTQTVPGKTNSPEGDEASGTLKNSSLNLETHTTTPSVETMGLKAIGRNVDVNQSININIANNGSLNVSIAHGTYPSVTMTGKGSGEKSVSTLYQYQAQSFMYTHGTRYIPMLIAAHQYAAAIEQSYRSYQFQKNSNSLNAAFKKQNVAKFRGFNAGQ